MSAKKLNPEKVIIKLRKEIEDSPNEIVRMRYKTFLKKFGIQRRIMRILDNVDSLLDKYNIEATAEIDKDEWYWNDLPLKTMLNFKLTNNGDVEDIEEEQDYDIFDDLQEADIHFNQANYSLAYQKYDEIYKHFLNKLGDKQFLQRVAKAIGITIGFLLGGFGLSDIIVVPALNKILMSVFNLVLDESIEKIQHCLFRKIECLCLDTELAQSLPSQEALNDFLIMYGLANEENETKLHKKFFDLVNPLTKDHKFELIMGRSLKDKIETKLVEHVVAENIYVGDLNEYLESYLRNIGREDSLLYTIVNIVLDGVPLPSNENKNCYELLGIEEGCTEEELKKVYRSKIFEWHPDRIPIDAAKEIKKYAEEMTKQINDCNDYIKSNEVYC